MERGRLVVKRTEGKEGTELRDKKKKTRRPKGKISTEPKELERKKTQAKSQREKGVAGSDRKGEKREIREFGGKRTRDRRVATCTETDWKKFWVAQRRKSTIGVGVVARKLHGKIMNKKKRLVFRGGETS